MIPAAILILATLLSYLPTLHAGFIWDDDRYITENPTLTTTGGLKQIWFDVGANVQYYPLVFTTFWLEHRLWDDNATGYHVVNVMLHVGVALLLWRVLARLHVPGAWLASALFALHPIQAESVAWVTERKNVLSGVLYLAALLAYFRFSPLSPPTPARNADENRRRRWWVAAFLLHFAALLSKTTACSLPAAILLLLWWKKQRIGRRDVLPLLPLFLSGMLMALLTAWVEKTHVGAEGSEWRLSFIERTLVAGRAFWFYLGKVVWPSKLTFIYPRWQIDAHAAWQYAFPFLAVAVIALLWFARQRLGKAPLAAALLYAGLLTPALGFFNVYYMQYSFVADHFAYLPGMTAIALIVASGTSLWQARLPRANGAWVALPLLLLLGGMTWRQSAIYADIETLWRDTLRKNPTAWLAHNNLGVLLKERGDLDGAARELRLALEWKPDYAMAHNNLGSVLALNRDPDGARREFLAAVTIQPGYAIAHENLGNVLSAQGQIENAVAHYRVALTLEPTLASAANNLAWILATHPDPRIRNGTEALKWAELACKATDFKDPSMLGTLAAAYAETADYLHATSTAEQALQLARALADQPLTDELIASLQTFRNRHPYRTHVATHPG